jgi:hypothetical protein
MTDSEYSEAGGSDSAVGDGTVVWSRRRTEIVGERGLMGVTGSECWRYQANTEFVSVRVRVLSLKLLHTSMPELRGVRRRASNGEAWRRKERFESRFHIGVTLLTSCGGHVWLLWWVCVAVV